MNSVTPMDKAIASRAETVQGFITSRARSVPLIDNAFGEESIASGVSVSSQTNFKGV